MFCISIAEMRSEDFCLTIAVMLSMPVSSVPCFPHWSKGYDSTNVGMQTSSSWLQSVPKALSFVPCPLAWKLNPLSYCFVFGGGWLTHPHACKRGEGLEKCTKKPSSTGVPGTHPALAWSLPAAVCARHFAVPCRHHRMYLTAAVQAGCSWKRYLGMTPWAGPDPAKLWQCGCYAVILPLPCLVVILVCLICFTVFEFLSTFPGDSKLNPELQRLWKM